MSVPIEWSVSKTWHYEPILLSYFISSLGAFTSLQLMRQRTGNRGRRNWLLLLSASIALAGVGIWSMHFIGMTAITFSSAGIELPFVFNIGITIASLLSCCTVVITAFYICASSTRLSWGRIIAGGIITGTGVAVMHYVGMMAMIIKAQMTYNIGIVIASCVIGVVASTGR